MALTQNSKRMVALGLLTGAVVGSYGVWQARKIAERPTTSGMIDWDRVRKVATSMNQEAALTGRQRARLDTEYRELVERTVPMVANYTGDTLPYPMDQIYAFDRVDWINANIESFKVMFEPIERLNLTENDKVPNAIGAIWTGFNQTVLSAEMGFLLGYLARRVLGQYDLALLGREPLETTGKLYFVHPNIRNLERNLKLPSDQFRLWLALHETTHAFEFEAHPWLREYMNGMLEEYFTFLSNDVEYLKRGFEAIRMFWDRARDNSSEANSWIEMVMTPGQRRLFNKMQAMMSVVEGYSNHVMNAVGRDLMPDFTTISNRFEQRQRNRTNAEQLFARLTGLDLKLEQYRLGEQFINEVVIARGHDFARRVWDGPESLPTLDELRRPEQWIMRMEQSPPAGTTI
ncbi:MAG TPA: zinc-dependent metalloprotease [Thermomicrobiales bacterium]|nr:zinc-dependent metalloprotease [Thermomicrobiales bacterium]